MTDKSTLEAFAKLLEPLAKSLSGIDRSLSLLADLELAKEFEPVAAKRQEHYAAINAALAADVTAYEAINKAREERETEHPGSHEELVKLKGKEYADKAFAPVMTALNARGEIGNSLRNLREAFPALDRIHHRRNS